MLFQPWRSSGGLKTGMNSRFGLYKLTCQYYSRNTIFLRRIISFITKKNNKYFLYYSSSIFYFIEYDDDDFYSRDIKDDYRLSLWCNRTRKNKLAYSRVSSCQALT